MPQFRIEERHIPVLHLEIGYPNEGLCLFYECFCSTLVLPLFTCVTKPPPWKPRCGPKCRKGLQHPEILARRADTCQGGQRQGGVLQWNGRRVSASAFLFVREVPAAHENRLGCTNKLPLLVQVCQDQYLCIFGHGSSARYTQVEKSTGENRSYSYKLQ